MADSEGKGGGGGGDGVAKGFEESKSVDGGGTAGQDEKLAQFIAFTGTTEEVANHWLEANAYSVESAVNMFMESGGSGGMVGASEPPVTGSSAAGGGHSGPRWRATTGGGSNGDGGAGPSPGDPDYVRPADPYKRQRLVDDVRPHGYGGMSTLRAWGAAVGGAMPFRDFAQESRDASNALGANGNPSSNPTLDRQRKLAAMFSPPTKIMFMGDFQMARQTAKQQKKCLLVNIQTDSEFDCHKLNRDVWKDETVENIIECKCIFWQQQSISEEAKTYCRRYNVVGFPHIALIDPRTGMKVWSFQGYLEPPEFIEKVTDIMDKMSLEDGAPVRLPPPPPPLPQLPPSAGGSEDQMVAAAIAESLKDSRNNFISTVETNNFQRKPPSTSSSSTRATGGNGTGAGNRQGMFERSGDNEGDNSGMGIAKRSGGGNSRVLANGAGSSASLPASVHDSDENDEDYDNEECDDVVDDDDVDGEDEEEDDDVAVLGSSAPVTSLSTSPPRGGELRSWDGRGSGMAAGLSAGGRGLVSTVAARGGDTVEGDVNQGVGKGKRKARDAGVGSSSGISRDVVDMTADDDGVPPSRSNSGSGSIGGGNGLVTNLEESSENVPEAEMLEEEPEAGSADVVRVRFRFPTGQNELRTFRKRSQVRQLFLFAMAKLDEAKSRKFDVRTVRPPKSVRDQERSSIEEAGLSNSTVVVAWED